MLPHLSFFLYFFLTYILPYLSFSLRIDPLCFQAECRKRRLNLAVVFVMCLFCVVVHFFSLVNACCCCVRFGFFAVPSQETGLAKLLRNGLFYVEWDAKPRPNQSTVACAGRFRLSLCGIRDGAALLGTKDEVTSENLWSRYDRHFVGITWHNVWS